MRRRRFFHGFYMQEYRFDNGDIIFREGDESFDAFYIAEGSVEICMGTGAGHRVLSVLGKGEIFGEMAMVTDHPRSATAIAVADGTRLFLFDETFFEEKIMSDPQQVRSLLCTLVERLRCTDAMFRAALSRDSDKDKNALATGEEEELETLFASSPVLEEATAKGDESEFTGSISIQSAYEADADFPPFAIKVKSLPYQIGRSFENRNGMFFSRADLILDDEAPFQVSRVQCDIIREGSRILVKDRGSRLGTIVNGKKIGAKSGVFLAELKPGVNDVVLGLDYSPHRMQVTLG